MRSRYRRTTLFISPMALVALGACTTDVVAPNAMSARHTPAPALIATHVAAPQPMATLFGPQRFTRTRGPANDFAAEVSTLRFEPPFTLHVRNGDGAGGGRVFGGSVAIDGRAMLSQLDLARQSQWAFPVTLGSSASVEVTLSGPPGGYLEIWIEGRRSLPVFCPGGPPGSYATLREAIDDVWVDGTVLVCDGEHAMDRVLVDKPLTLRSQNPAGATIADALEERGFSAGMPALVIDGIPAGVVRIADVNFLVRNEAIRALGTFDQVQLDSVRMVGRRLQVPVGLRTSINSVPTARVEVVRSHFQGLHIAVWPVSAVETNVRWSTFDGLSGGSVVYSGTSVAGVASASFGTTEHNSFTNCSTFGCVRLVGPGAAAGEIVIARNTMRPSTVLQDFAVFVNRTPLPGAPPPARIVVEDNDVAGPAPSGGHFMPQSWGIRTFVTALGGPGGAPMVVRNNRATNVFTFITAGAPVTGHDNVMTGGFFAVFQQNPAVHVEFTRNDVQFTSSLNRDPVAPGDPGNYRCNWWGSAAGPLIPAPNVMPSSYTPWSTVPIANTNVACDAAPSPPPPPPAAIVRVCGTALASGPPTFATMALAYAAVATGGTILVCDGTHIVQDVRVAKALTVRNEGPGKPTLDAAGARSNFDVRDVAGGDVVLRGLRFRGTRLSLDGAGGFGANVNIEGSYRIITIEESEFFPSGQLVAYDMPEPGQPRLTYNSGVWTWNATGDSIVVRTSVFTGGDVGVGGSGTHVRVESNAFSANATGAVHRGPTGSTVIADNDISDCGTAWCIGSFSSGASRVLRNRIRVDAPRQTSRVILVDNPEATVTGNIITGTGGARVAGDRTSFPMTYAVAAHASRRTVPTTYDIRDNVISGAYAGIDVAAVTTLDQVGSVHVLATDNIISDVAVPFSSSGGQNLVTLMLNRNDFTGYLAAAPNIQVSHFAAIDARCNWWGQASGPAGGYPVEWQGVLFPWATAPIAGRPAGSC